MRRHRPLLFLLLLCALSLSFVLVACTSPDTEIVNGAPDAAPVPPPQSIEAGVDAGPELVFRACPGQFSGVCTEIEVPLDWANPTGKKITIFVDKISTSAKATKALWLLQGGPGASGADMVPIARAIAEQRSDVDVYTLDHRGVGFSTRLGCPEEPGVFAGSDAGILSDAATADPTTNVTPCLDALKAKWGSDLAFFNTSNAARDLAYAIDRTKKPGQQAIVYGVSYGTYWAHRYLQIFPDHPGGVILDSIVPPEGEALSMFDLHGDLAGAKLGELCKKDAVCNANLGPDPWARAKSILAMVGTGHCPDFPITKDNRILLFPYLQQWGLNVYPFAALHRYERCSADDVTVLRLLADKTSVFGGLSPLFSQLLYYNVAFSELWETPAPTDAELRARFDGATFPAGVALDIPRSIWPVYAPDEFQGKYAKTSVPVLMLNGTLDVQTPIETAIRMKDHLNGPHQTFVTIPNANHGTIQQSPTRGDLGIGQGPPCGLMIIQSFLDDPKGALDTSCLANLAPLDFSGDDPANDFFFGTKSIWTGVASPHPTAPPAITPFARPRHFTLGL